MSVSSLSNKAPIREGENRILRAGKVCGGWEGGEKLQGFCQLCLKHCWREKNNRLKFLASFLTKISQHSHTIDKKCSNPNLAFSFSFIIQKTVKISIDHFPSAHKAFHSSGVYNQCGSPLSFPPLPILFPSSPLPYVSIFPSGSSCCVAGLTQSHGIPTS